MSSPGVVSSGAQLAPRPLDVVLRTSRRYARLSKANKLSIKVADQLHWRHEDPQEGPQIRELLWRWVTARSNGLSAELSLSTAPHCRSSQCQNSAQTSGVPACYDQAEAVWQKTQRSPTTLEQWCKSIAADKHDTRGKN
ncbi:hypothetical protein WJX77_005866 [Trebouxia sp. C0004]